MNNKYKHENRQICICKYTTFNCLNKCILLKFFSFFSFFGQFPGKAPRYFPSFKGWYLMQTHIHRANFFTNIGSMSMLLAIFEHV